MAHGARDALLGELEHAIVHPYRHLRQLRGLGFVAEDALDAARRDA